MWHLRADSDRLAPRAGFRFYNSGSPKSRVSLHLNLSSFGKISYSNVALVWTLSGSFLGLIVGDPSCAALDYGPEKV